MEKREHVKNGLLSALLGVLCLAWVYPILMILFNSLKQERAITTADAFKLPTATTFAGLENYVNALTSQGFLAAFWYSLVITVSSVVLILVCCSMCAWYITRIETPLTKACYFLFVFSMVVPFQMLMFTLSSTADRLQLSNPYNICIIYLGFGAGLAVFMFCGFMRSIPIAVEEAALIDGCNPLQTFFGVVLPILKPTLISVGILETMWLWNDYLLPYLILGTGNKTLPVAIQIAMQGAYGAVNWGGFMAMLVLAILPIIVFYLFCQRYIIEGVIAGAVKG